MFVPLSLENSTTLDISFLSESLIFSRNSAFRRPREKPHRIANSVNRIEIVPSSLDSSSLSVSTDMIPVQTLKSVSMSSLGPEMVILSNPSDLASSRCLRSSDALMFDPTLLFLAIALFVDFNVGTKTPKRIRGTVCTLVSDVEESVITSPVV